MRDPQTLLARLQKENVELLAKNLLLAVEPLIFDGRPEANAKLQAHFRLQLGIPEGAVIVVGSGRFGFSVSPDKFGKPFSDFSDVDLAVVSVELFDQIWGDLLRWRYPWHLRKWRPAEQNWALERLEEHYMGWCDPKRLTYQPFDRKRQVPTMMAFGNKWFEVLQGLGAVTGLLGREFNGRIYRSFDHLLGYHTWSLEQVKKSHRRTAN